ncbi:SCAN domain-containing protein 3-like [Scylla paramamosain]|uniref:SCAN domain-containing protein 3-like n=1 Tax=Scylla paramamosain TaxID=85552 RepID=UPI003082DA4C
MREWTCISAAGQYSERVLAFSRSTVSTILFTGAGTEYLGPATLLDLEEGLALKDDDMSSWNGWPAMPQSMWLFLTTQAFALRDKYVKLWFMENQFIDTKGTVMASNKKRNYDDNYLDFGFTSITDKGVVKPQCVICHKILTAESLRPMQCRISQISDDIKEQVIQEIKRAGLFNIQLDESTDIQSCSQLLAFVRQALASKTLPSELQDTLNTIIKTVNFVEGSALNTYLFKRLCQDMDAAHETLLFHTAVRWLSKGNVVQSVFELREEISLFLRIQNKQDLLSAWSADSFEIRLGYLVDIFRQLNTLNLELQGKGSLIIDSVDKVKAFIRKMENWRHKVGMGNLAMLKTVSEIVEECDAATQNLITQHLEALEEEF